MEPIITSKPSPFLLEDICTTHGISPARTLMVGDRLDTDILWGQNTGMETLLVLTGGLAYKLTSWLDARKGCDAAGCILHLHP